ncbi:hypothetical protein HYY71_03185 [Candidatus Woesearchaeota archaeon]|nr:hypothetical protein [Candidatus Woesearchaeota archaeon]
MDRMLSKRAIELSLNFIVILIISIIIFGFGVRFIQKLSSQATELQDITISELDERIGDLVCAGSERVCLGIDRKAIRRTKFDVFGLKIINILESQGFDIIVSRPTPSGYTKTKQPIQTDNLLWNPRSRSVYIEKNEEKNLGIGVQVPPNAVSGTYIFNIMIQGADGRAYSATQKLYVDVP